MTPHELFRAGRLADAIAAQIQEVKTRPTDPDARVALFALLCFSGDLERAENHLRVVSLDGEGANTGASVYHALLAAEYERRKVHQEGAHPVFPPDAPAFLAQRLAALHACAAGDADAVQRDLSAAAEASAALYGKRNGEAFDSVRDDDEILGPILEIYAGGRCLWMPFASIRRLVIAPPARQLDLLWAQAELEDAQGNQATVHLPTLYAGSHAHADESVKFGRTTEWVDFGGVAFRGTGQKILHTTAGAAEHETPYLEIRDLEIALDSRAG